MIICCSKWIPYSAENHCILVLLLNVSHCSMSWLLTPIHGDAEPISSNALSVAGTCQAIEVFCFITVSTWCEFRSQEHNKTSSSNGSPSLICPSTDSNPVNRSLRPHQHEHYSCNRSDPKEKEMERKPRPKSQIRKPRFMHSSKSRKRRVHLAPEPIQHKEIPLKNNSQDHVRHRFHLLRKLKVPQYTK